MWLSPCILQFSWPVYAGHLWKQVRKKKFKSNCRGPVSFSFQLAPLKYYVLNRCKMSIPYQLTKLLRQILLAHQSINLAFSLGKERKLLAPGNRNCFFFLPWKVLKGTRDFFPLALVFQENLLTMVTLYWTYKYGALTIGSERHITNVHQPGIAICIRQLNINQRSSGHRQKANRILNLND